MRHFQQAFPDIGSALTSARDLLARGIEVTVVPMAGSGCLVRVPDATENAAPGAGFTAVDLPSPSEEALRSLLVSIDAMRTSGKDACIVDTANDGPEHWFGGFSNFSLDFETDRIAFSWPTC